jgi:hypothetical protein
MPETKVDIFRETSLRQGFGRLARHSLGEGWQAE